MINQLYCLHAVLPLFTGTGRLRRTCTAAERPAALTPGHCGGGAGPELRLIFSRSRLLQHGSPKGIELTAGASQDACGLGLVPALFFFFFFWGRSRVVDTGWEICFYFSVLISLYSLKEKKKIKGERKWPPGLLSRGKAKPLQTTLSGFAPLPSALLAAPLRREMGFYTCAERLSSFAFILQVVAIFFPFRTDPSVWLFK